MKHYYLLSDNKTIFQWLETMCAQDIIRNSSKNPKMLGWDLFTYNPEQDSPTDLIEEITLWEAYAEINEEDFNELESHIKYLYKEKLSPPDMQKDSNIPGGIEISLTKKYTQEEFKDLLDSILRLGYNIGLEAKAPTDPFGGKSLEDLLKDHLKRNFNLEL